MTYARQMKVERYYRPSSLLGTLTHPEQPALQVYCQIYKQAPVAQAHALLRKARRLDQILNIRTDAIVNTPSPSPDPQCHKCQCKYSPAFYHVPSSSGPGGIDVWVCHKCNFDANKPNGTNGITTTTSTGNMELYHVGLLGL